MSLPRLVRPSVESRRRKVNPAPRLRMLFCSSSGHEYRCAAKAGTFRWSDPSGRARPTFALAHGSDATWVIRSGRSRAECARRSEQRRARSLCLSAVGASREAQTEPPNTAARGCSARRCWRVRIVRTVRGLDEEDDQREHGDERRAPASRATRPSSPLRVSEAMAARRDNTHAHHRASSRAPYPRGHRPPSREPR